MNRKVQALLVSLFLISCTSQFADKSPDGQGAADATVDSQMKASEGLDARIARMEAAADKVRSVVRTIHEAKQKLESDDGGTPYTYFDFIIDVSKELKRAPVETSKGKFVRHGKIDLNLEGVSQECRHIETLVETVSQGEQPPVNEEGESIDGLVLSVRTCRSSGQFLPVINVSFVKNHTLIDFNQENLRTTLNDILVPVIQANSNCDLSLDSRGRIEAGRCVNLVAKFDKSLRWNINELVYDQSAEYRFGLDGIIFENETPKATLRLTWHRTRGIGGKLELIPPAQP